MEELDLTHKCCICGSWFDNPAVFPDDFPDEWKMCCSCNSYAIEITEMGDVEKVISAWITIIRVDYRKKFVAKLLKIDKLIKVV